MQKLRRIFDNQNKFFLKKRRNFFSDFVGLLILAYCLFFLISNINEFYVILDLLLVEVVNFL